MFKEVAQDISFALHSIELEEEHKRTEEEVKKEKKFSDNIITTVSDSLIVLDKDLKIKNVNRTFYKAFQTEPEKVIGRSITNILGDGDGKLTFELTKLVGTEDMLENFEMLYKSEKQGERIFNVRARGILIAEEEEVIVLEDITERKRMEEAMRLFSEELELKVEERTKELKNERDYTRHLIGSSPDFQLTLDKEGNIMDVNEAFEHIVGRSREELIGSSIYEYLPKSTTEKAIVEILEKDKVRDIEIKADIPKKDSILNCSCTIFTISEGEVGIYATGRDTTELRTKEMQLIHAGRLASLGELATGVAHEINQPLTVISMAAGGRLLDIEKKCLDMNTLPQDLEDILGNVKRIDRIITHMRTFARKPEEWEHLEPEEVLSNVFILLGEQFKMQDIPVSRKIEANLPLIKADENQLEQVFVNILTNARQALDERGENAKEEGERFEKQMVCCISKERENGKGWVVFEFADNAFGVPPELKMRVFEPFFTTKEAGEGTGLGLSIAYSIVTQSLGGNIWVEDNDMGGASFKVALPVEGKEEKKEVAEEEVRDYI